MAIGVLASVLPWQDATVEKHRNRYYGEYLGFVRDRADPVRAGRVRVQVPSLMSQGNGSDSWLDWCLPKSAGLAVPPVGSPVCITFEQGIITHGLYEWGWIQGDDPNASTAPVAGKGLAQDPTWVQEETFTSGGEGPVISHTLTKDPAVSALPQYPWNKVYQSEGGHIVEVDDSPGQARARYYHPAGTTILVDSDGSVHLRTKGSIFQESAGDHVIVLKPGASYKVVYPNGTSLILGASGFHVTGHQSTILGRTVVRNEKPL